MTPDEVGAALARALGEDGVTTGVSGGDQWARATVDVPANLWVDALTCARDELGCDYFDWLSGVDEEEQGFAVVAHVWSTTARHGVLIRTRVPRESPAVASVVDVYPGAAWHERESHEMFGIDFPGHPNLVPLLLPPEFEGHPLRKDFVLASRVAKPWPGAKEPGESHVDTGKRRQPMRPPGVPAPGEWGPTPPEVDRPERPGRPQGERPPPRPARPERPSPDRASRTGPGRPDRNTPGQGAPKQDGPEQTPPGSD